MREIKFRVWDKDNLVRKMSYGNIEYFDDMVGFRFNHFDGDIEDLVFMQYTGLKDSFSKEIYEGDIIEKQGSKVETGIYEIGFEEGSFMASGRKGIDWWDDLCNIIWCQSGEVVKVIGNIYENPELIEGDKE